jgi:two-component system, sensor histidine kinase and response regulator
MSQILVIEDEQEIRQNLVKILEYEGYTALGAEDGRAGVALAKQHRPDLIICDIMMPALSGYGVLIELRRNPRTAAIPFIFLTAKSTKKDIRQGMQFGADAYLTKPVDLDALLVQVATILLQQESDVSKQLETLRVNLARALPPGLQAPLTAIIGFSGVLAEAGIEMLPKPDEIIAMQTAIYEQALRLQQLMTDHLLYAELQLRKADPERQPRWPRVGVLTKDVITTAARKKAEAAGRQADLVFDLVDAKIPLFPGSLQKILDELIDQAVTSSAPGTPVRVATTAADERLTLTITDHGQRITKKPDTDLVAQRLREDTPYEHGGPWLGVNICRLLAELHGGSLVIETGVEKETTVTVVLA